MSHNAAILRKLLWSVGTNGRPPIQVPELGRVTVGQLLAGTRDGSLLVLRRTTAESIAAELEARELESKEG